MPALVGAYPNALVATAGNGVSGNASYTVTPGPLAAITILPALANMTVGATQSFSASGSDAFGNPISGLNLAWSAIPGAGAITSSGPLTAVFTAGTTPGTYPESVRASSQGVTGTANLFLAAGPPAQVVVEPAAATIDIGGVRAFTASVFDAFGNPLNLGVTWLTPSNAGSIESRGPLTAVFKAGTVAGTFGDGLVATNSQASDSAAITVPPDPASKVALTANPTAITTDGKDATTLVAAVTDAYGNATGAGTPINLAVTDCAGACQLEPLSGVSDAQGRFFATLRSTYTSPTQSLTSLITVAAQANVPGQPANQSVTVMGAFSPKRSLLPVVNNYFPLNNHTSCMALFITPPQTVVQPPNNVFNIYRFVAQSATNSVIVRGYTVAGQLLLYRILADNCALNGTMTVEFVGRPMPITSASQFGVTLTNQFIPGQQYLLAVNTTGAGSSQPYSISVQP
jgi:hypothetical protein